MNRIAKLVFTAVVTAVSLTGCVVYDGYGYYEDDYYDDDSYGYYDSRPAYSYGSRYDTSVRYAPYAPDYIYWSDYYSVLWPTYRYYYDPVFSPHFFYGVTWFPTSYFGIHYSRYQWPYYHAYSPYRYSYWDNYYDWRWRNNHQHYTHHDRGPRRGSHHYDPYPRYGSARNESERIAAYTGMSRYRGMASPGVQVQPYDQNHVFGWRNDGVRGHYPNQQALQEGPQPFFRNARGVDPLDWRGANAYNRNGEPVDGWPAAGGAAAESSRLQRGTGWNNDPEPGVQGSGRPDRGYGAPNERQPRQSGWVGQFPEPRSSAPQRPGREAFGSDRGSYPSTGGSEPAPRFERPEPRQDASPQFERPLSTEPQYRTAPGGRESRFESTNRYESTPRTQPRFEAPQRSEPRYQTPERVEQRYDSPRFERQQQFSQPRFEAPQRSEPRFEAPQRSEPRFEAPQRSEPRFEAPQRSEPRFEAPQRSEPRFEAPSRNDDGGGSARGESMRMGRGGDREE